MLGKLENAEIEEVLKNQNLGRIGCHSDGLTYIVPVSYTYDGNDVFVFSKDGLKVDMMRKNPGVCFEVENFLNMGNWKTVIAWGTFEEIVDFEEREKALHLLLDRRFPIISSETARIHIDWPFKPEDVNSIEGVVYRIHLEKKTGRFENMKGVSTVSKAFLAPFDSFY
jgi:nitroimidazol reductase NimA-like FMN-containing flavoprotein (pyridoxamine 5'-phosphate oxidase superfamily)